MTRHIIQHGGLEREYYVFRPSAYRETANSPVVFFLHGYGGTATGVEAEVAQGLNFYAEQHGYVMVYPQGTWFISEESAAGRQVVTSWNHISDGFDSGPAGPICTADATRYPCPPECGTCGDCGWSACHDDVGFLKSLVQTVTAEFAVDQARVFIGGFSNGAMMANRIACEAAELFAGVALLGGRLEPGFECTPTRKIPLLQVNGGADTTVPHDGSVSSAGYYYASTQAVSDHWNDGAACSAERADWRHPVIANADVQCAASCADTAHASIDCLWPDGDHRWPGTPGIRGSNGYCVSEQQSPGMPEQALCIAPDHAVENWGSALLFAFFDEYRGN
tara:strand:- start:424 stop:1428 length:1005 start_codon:yes stop_codon:yes gene_type:complete